MLYLLFTIIGFFPLIWGAHILVDSASALAKRLDIPNIVIGLTIVAFGTSSPELVVNLFAAINNDTDIVMGNIIGSNIFNILGILGISAIVYPLSVKSNTTWIEIPLALLSALLVIVTSNDILFDNAVWSGISRVDGMVFLLFFLVFLGYNIKLAKAGNDDEDMRIKDYTIRKSIIGILIGLVLLVIGGRVIVVYSVEFARLLNISERIIALTIISIGTSLPELATSITAAMKRNVDIAIGNVVGSNIFNIFLILGLSAVISPVRVLPISNTDMIVNIVSSLMLFIFVFTGKENKLERWEGSIFLFLYCFYLIYLLIGNTVI